MLETPRLILREISPTLVTRWLDYEAGFDVVDVRISALYVNQTRLEGLCKTLRYENIRDLKY